MFNYSCCARSIVRFFKDHCISLVAIIIAFTIAFLSFDYVDCVSLTTWSVSVWDALFNGRILDYSAVTFENIRGAPHGGNTGGFVMLLPWAIWNFPLWITHLTPGNLSIDDPVCIIWSKLFLFLCLLLSSYLIKKIAYEISNDSTISDYGFLLSLGAGTAIISVGYAGQDEVMYLATFLASIYCYIKGRKAISFLLMIFSLGCFPVLVIPLAILLIIQNFGIVKTIAISGIGLLLGMFIFHIGGSSEGYGTFSEYIEWFFYRTYIVSAEGALSFFMIVVALIMLYYLTRKENNISQASIIAMAILSMSALIFCWMHFYRYYICLPAIVLSLVLLNKKDKNLFKTGLLLFTIVNYATFIIACQDANCWNYRYFLGFLSNFISFDYQSNYLWIIFGNETYMYAQMVLSGLFATFLALVYLLLREPGHIKDFKINEKSLVSINCVCPLLMMAIYFLVPIVIK